MWAATGIKLKNLDSYKKFGLLRNSIQHFTSPENVNCSDETIKFIYQVIDPFIYDCWGVTAIDYNEDSEPYIYLMENLIANGIEFLVSEEAAAHFYDVRLNWPTEPYKILMIKRFKAAGADISDL